MQTHWYGPLNKHVNKNCDKHNKRHHICHPMWSNSPCFHCCLDSATWEDNLLLQSEETPHRCLQLYTDKHEMEVREANIF